MQRRLACYSRCSVADPSARAEHCHESDQVQKRKPLYPKRSTLPAEIFGQIQFVKFRGDMGTRYSSILRKRTPCMV
jgi:hypothetical protein